MPLVLTVSENTESGHEYRDELWVAHEYPRRYAKRIVPGELFVYYRGRHRGRAVDAQGPYLCYLGTGMIGSIHQSENEGHLICEIVGAEEFKSPVPFKRTNGTYIEPGGDRRGYWQPGVRAIDESVFSEILRLGGQSTDSLVPIVGGKNSGVYASPERAREIELYSREQTIRRLIADVPGIDLEEMPYNHPGYDIRTNHQSLEYVEVKGTQSPTPRFLMSDVERNWWSDHSGNYAVYTVYGIDLEQQRHSGVRRFTDEPDSLRWLRPHQWLGMAGDHDGDELEI